MIKNFSKRWSYFYSLWKYFVTQATSCQASLPGMLYHKYMNIFKIFLHFFNCQEHLQNAAQDIYQQGIFLVFYSWLSFWKHWTLFSFQTVQGKVGLKCECSSKKILQLLKTKSRSQVLLTLIRKALDVYCNTTRTFLCPRTGNVSHLPK